MKRINIGWLRPAGLLLLALIPALAGAQYPNRVIRMIVPYAPGTAADALARVAGDRLAAGLGQAVVIDNRPGAGANIGNEATAKAPNDGYTLMLATIDLASNPNMYRSVNYDPVRDFTAIAPLARIAGLLVVPADSPAKTVQELIALAKARPGTLNFASGGNGTQAHFGGVMFAQAAGIDVVHVPYRGAADMVGSLLSSQTAFAFPTFVTVLPLVQSGKLRALAVTSPARNPKLPNVPTMKEALPPGFELNAWFGIVGPAGMPADIVNRLNGETVKILTDPAMRERLEADGTKVFTGTPAEFAALIKSDYARWGEIVKQTGIKVD
jgi:tripartite-type tricarboxylate transporter receptor subunit TctC